MSADRFEGNAGSSPSTRGEGAPLQKKCIDCGHKLPLSAFGKNRGTEDGLHYYCNECRAKQREYDSFAKRGREFVLCATCGKRISPVKIKHHRIKYCLVCARSAPPEPWREKSAYLTGIVATDGCLHRERKRFSFANADPMLMKTFLLLAETTIQPIWKQYPSGPIPEVAVTDASYYNLFTAVGLTPNKSLTIGELKLPRGKLERIEHFWLFFRGVFEGDGGIGHLRGKPCMRIHSGSETFLRWLREEMALSFQDENVLKFRIAQHKERAWAFCIPTSHIPALHCAMYTQYDKQHITVLGKKIAFSKLGQSRKRERMGLWAQKLSVSKRTIVFPYGDATTS